MLLLSNFMEYVVGDGLQELFRERLQQRKIEQIKRKIQDTEASLAEKRVTMKTELKRIKSKYQLTKKQRANMWKSLRHEATSTTRNEVTCDQHDSVEPASLEATTDSVEATETGESVHNVQWTHGAIRVYGWMSPRISRTWSREACCGRSSML